MKTNQTLTRQMGCFSVYQRTSDGMFNATELLKQWNKNGKKKDMDDFLSNKMTKEYITVIESKENINTQKSGDLKVVKSAIDHCKGVTVLETPTPGGYQSIKYGKEGEVYRLTMKSKLPHAEKFQDWVCDDILPSIRKNAVEAMEHSKWNEKRDEGLLCQSFYSRVYQRDR